MHRRLTFRLAFAALLTLALVACTTVGDLLSNRVTVSPEQLQSQLDRRFPRDYRKLGGMLSVRVMHPRLRLQPERHRLLLDFDAGIAAFGSNPSTPRGHFTVSSGLRFDPAAMALMLDAPAVERADIPALAGMGQGAIQSLLDQWLLDEARNEPVYRFSASDQDKLRGRSIRSIDVAASGLQVQLGNGQ
ncbi:MAG: DUF1439 domain-containing protein [Proteobacteria bacterium]|nr:DUF1439 domain-containing protein [Pseudomonadota bacterium]